MSSGSAAVRSPRVQETVIPTRVRPDRRHGLLVGLGLAVSVLALSVLTILRYTVDFLQADGVQQSVMSVQDVDLFFWGQNRFAAVVSALVSPIADPDANLFACLLVNAVCFHLLFLIVARMGVLTLVGERSWAATALTFLVLAMGAQLLITPAALHIISLESQPYSMSWALTLGAFLLWKSGRWWWWVLAAVFVGTAAGLNQSTILVAAFLALVEMLRRRQWVRWPLFGALWVVWLGIWTVLSARYGGNAGPIPDAKQDYFTFDSHIFLTDASRSLASVLSSFRIPRLAVFAIFSAAVCLALTAPRRSALLTRGAATFAFVALYWVIFTGNPWVQANSFALRYFFPVILLVVVTVAAPLAAALCSLAPSTSTIRWVRVPVGWRPAALLTAVLLPVLGLAYALHGPLTSPSQATVLVETRPTADYARAHGVTFIAGYYWDMWPILHRVLADGRHAGFVTAFKSGGDPAAYRQAFVSELAGGRAPEAICVNETVGFCRTYLDYWTRAGWMPTGETCPAPQGGPTLGSPAQPSCVVLRYSGV